MGSQLDRIEDLVASMKASIDRITSTVPTDLIELTNDLHPQTAGTYQTHDIAAPFLYRNQAILASSDTLQKDMEYCQMILQSLLIDHPQATSSAAITPASIQEAPILNTSTQGADADKQLAVLTKTIHDLQSRVQSASLRVDRLLQSYQGFVTAASEALVNAHENRSRTV
jgi:hypothetical protein